MKDYIFSINIFIDNLLDSGLENYLIKFTVPKHIKKEEILLKLNKMNNIIKDINDGKSIHLLCNILCNENKNWSWCIYKPDAIWTDNSIDLNNPF